MSNSYLALLKSFNLPSKSSRQKPVSCHGSKVNRTFSFGSVSDAIQSPLNIADGLLATDALAAESDPASVNATQSEADCDPTTIDALPSATGCDPATIDATQSAAGGGPTTDAQPSATGSDHATIDAAPSPSNSYLALIKSFGLRSKSSRQKPVSHSRSKVNPIPSLGSVPDTTTLRSSLNTAYGHSVTNASATGGKPAASDTPASSNSYRALLKSIGLRSESSRQKPVSCNRTKVSPASSFESVPADTALRSSLYVDDRYSATDASDCDPAAIDAPSPATKGSATGADPVTLDAPSRATDRSATGVNPATIDAPPPSNSYLALLKSNGLRSKSKRQKHVSCYRSKVNPTPSFGNVSDATALRSSLNVADGHLETDASANGDDLDGIDASLQATDGSATGGDRAAIDTPPLSNSYLPLIKSVGFHSKSSRQKPVSCYESNVNPTSSFGSASALRSSLNVADRHSAADSSESDYDPSATDALPSAARVGLAGTYALPSAARGDLAATNAPSVAAVIFADTEAQPSLSTGSEEWNLVQYQLLLILHANICPSNENQPNEDIGQCPFFLLTNKTLYYHCSTMRQVLRHMSTCQGERFCNDTRCYSSAQIISHWINCTHDRCFICVPLKQKTRRIQRKMAKRGRKEEKRLKRNRSKDGRNSSRNLRLKKSN